MDRCPRLRATMATARKRPWEPRLGLLAAGRPRRSSGPRPLRLCSEHTKDTCMPRPGAQLLAASPSFQASRSPPSPRMRLYPRKPGSGEAFLQERGFPKATIEKSCAVSEGRESNVQNPARKDLIRGNSGIQVRRGEPLPLPSHLSLAPQVLPLPSPWSGSGCPGLQPRSLGQGWAASYSRPPRDIAVLRGRREAASLQGGSLGAEQAAAGGFGEQLLFQASQSPDPGSAHHALLALPPSKLGDR